MINLVHHDDGKGKVQSHDVSISEYCDNDVIATWNAFEKMLCCPAIPVNIVEVDCLGNSIPSGPVLPENAKPGDIFIQKI